MKTPPPDPQTVRQARAAAGMTQAQAGALVHVNGPTWQQWEREAGPHARRMHPAFFELFRIKASKQLDK